MSGKWLMLGGVTVVLLVSGCAAKDDPSSSAGPSSSSAPAQTTTAPPAGPVDIVIGQPFELSNNKGVTAKATLSAVEVNPLCTSPASPLLIPLPGTKIVLQLDIQTTVMPPSSLSGTWFSGLSRDGVTTDSELATGKCASREPLPAVSQPNTRYQGWLTVESTNARQRPYTLLLRDPSDTRPQPAVFRIALPN
ncbi:hypothetical protein [Nocardia concava]|uniref:hypothetical protein n=1 Tax=Nocardia concava TaxID=257281 RepID=UPI0012FC0A94|nr:hypothetical protein [Nocardia concava]